MAQTRDDENIGSISKFYFGASAESAERAPPPQLLHDGAELYARERTHARTLKPVRERKLIAFCRRYCNYNKIGNISRLRKMS